MERSLRERYATMEDVVSDLDKAALRHRPAGPHRNSRSREPEFVGPLPDPPGEGETDVPVHRWECPRCGTVFVAADTAPPGAVACPDCGYTNVRLSTGPMRYLAGAGAIRSVGGWRPVSHSERVGVGFVYWLWGVATLAGVAILLFALLLAVIDWVMGRSEPGKIRQFDVLARILWFCGTVGIAIAIGCIGLGMSAWWSRRK
jgi:ribosomal protein S27AE